MNQLTYVQLKSDPQSPVITGPPFKATLWGWVKFFIGAAILGSTGIGFAFGLCLWFIGLRREDKSEPTTLWLLCTAIGGFALFLGAVALALGLIAVAILAAVNA